MPSIRKQNDLPTPSVRITHSGKHSGLLFCRHHDQTQVTLRQLRLGKYFSSIDTSRLVRPAAPHDRETRLNSYTFWLPYSVCR